MKTTKIYSILACIMLMMSACGEDFLNKADPTVLVSDNFYSNEKELEQAVAGVYGILRTHFNNEWQFNEYISDNTTLHFNVGNRGAGPSLEAIEFWQYNAATPNVATLYNGVYSVMVNVNTTLKRLPDANARQEVKTRAEGELKMIRAYLYFQLVQHFGDVIIITEPISTPSEAFAFERQPVEAVYAQIITDLDQAITALPATYPANQTGRVTKGAALALLGKVRLTRKEYPQAIAALNQVVGLNYQLLPNYASIFLPANKNHKESIWDIQYQGDNLFGVHSNFIYTFAPRESAGAVIKFPGQEGGGWNTPTRDIIQAYEEGDLRKDVSLKEGYFNLQGTWVPVPFINKYNHPHTIRGVTNDNWPVIRYADVLLMLAEAINEQSGPTADAYNHLNAIRERAGLQPLSGLTKDSFRTALLKERRLELAFENHRWLDLKRTMTTPQLVSFLNAYGLRERANPTTSRGGIPFSNDDFIFQPHQVLFPIPEVQTRINPALRQNPGYN
jgi:starch-binding outer membrane protein, SusD/RagB family